jgi:hypothetical protein
MMSIGSTWLLQISEAARSFSEQYRDRGPCELDAHERDRSLLYINDDELSSGCGDRIFTATSLAPGLAFGRDSAQSEITAQAL